MLQEETVKTKRLQSVGELPTPISTSSNVHGRPSIATTNTSETQDADDGTPAPPVQVVEASTNKSPINASGSTCRLTFRIVFNSQTLFFIIILQ